MTQPFISFAFSAGVLAPAFLQRSDIEKFDLGLRFGHNWIVDYRGGVSVRPPLEFISYLDCSETDQTRLYPFQFNKRIGNTYLLVFSDELIRFVQNGRFLTNAAVAVSGYENSGAYATETRFASTAHGLSTGDEVYLTITNPDLNYLTNYLFEVVVLDVDHFQLKTPVTAETAKLDLSHTGTNLTGVTQVSKVYSIASPYAQEDLAALVLSQYRDELRITSNDYAPRILTRLADTNWTLAPINFRGNRTAPNAPAIEITTVTNGGDPFNPDAASLNAGVLYAVTSVNSAGVESYVRQIGLSETMIDITNNAGSLKVSWAAVAGSIRYVVYRSTMVPRGHEASFGQQIGYIGETTGLHFTDNNIIPDFTRTPLVPDNPFANGAVLSISITAGGTDYLKGNTTISIAGGTGFEGLVIVNGAGVVTGVRIMSPGSGYTNSSTVTIGGDGTGATATITASPASGNFPACSTRFKQRHVYGGTLNLPMSLFMSRVGPPDNFDFTPIGTASDALDLALDSAELTPIQHLITANLGLLAFTDQQVYHIRGTDNNLVSATSLQADPITDDGAESILPIKVEDKIVYIVSGSSGVNGIEPTNLRNSYQIIDLSVFSSHFFAQDNKIIRWAYANRPDKQIWAVREDGTALCFTYVPDQNVYAWTDHSTQGRFLDVSIVRENNYDRVYFVVARDINGTCRHYLERLDLSQIEFNERIFAVDCFKEPVVTALQARGLTVSGFKGPGLTATLTDGSTFFDTRAVGDLIRINRGLGRVTAIASDGVSLTFDTIIPIKVNAFQNVTTYHFTTWNIDTPSTTLRGNYQFLGGSVESVGETEVVKEQSTASTDMTLTTASSRVFAGFPYTATLVTLPLKIGGEVIQDKKKRIADISVRTLNSKELLGGTLSSADFYELSISTYDDYELEEFIGTDISEIHISGEWREDDSLVIRKSRPFRGSVLGFVINSEIGLD